MIDLVVAGGGPVGLVTALHATHAGLEVQVFEPRQGAIDKACGEGLMPGALAELTALGIRPDGYPLRGIRYHAEHAQAEAVFRAGSGLGVRRTTLHECLAAAVSAAGIPVVQRTVQGVTQDDQGVRFDGVRTRYLAAADGLHSPLRRELGLQRRPRAGRRYGLRAHVQSAPWTDLVEVHWSSDAEAYVTPVAADLVNIAVLSAQRRPFPEQLTAFAGLRARLDSGSWTSVRGAGPLHQQTTRRVAGRVMLVGDASGYVDALTGEGMAVGFAQGRSVVKAVLADDARSYGRAWQRITWRPRLLTTGLLVASQRPTLRRAIVPAAGRLPGVFSAAVNELARPA